MFTGKILIFSLFDSINQRFEHVSLVKSSYAFLTIHKYPLCRTCLAQEDLAGRVRVDDGPDGLALIVDETLGRCSGERSTAGIDR